MNPTEIMIDIQEQIYNGRNQMRTDVHYEEGRGAFVVPEFAPLLPQNVIVQVPFMMFFIGQKVTINF